MSEADILKFYTQHSRITDPGKQAHLFADLPRDIPGLCRTVQGLIVHYNGEFSIPPERLPEVDTRYVEAMLARIMELDDRPLTEARPPEKRLVGCCRDFAVLFCAMARHLGIPTRARVGFAAYINLGQPGFYVDHEVAEFWDGARWRLVDPEQTPELIERNQIQFDVTNIPRDQFVVSGMAWRGSKAGTFDPNQFGVEPADTFLRGWWFMRDRMLVDFMGLTKREILLWDSWGLMEYEPAPTEAEEKRLDRIAEITEAEIGSAEFEEIQNLYETQPRLKMPLSIMNYSPAAEPRQISITI
jgi:hypothetical protein